MPQQEWWPGATVPGRKRRFNPWTHSGNPAWNTFQGLGIRSAVKEINQGLSNEAHERRNGMRLGGRKSRVHGKRRLDPSNLLHRANERMDRAACHYEDARVLSLKLDRSGPGPAHDALLHEYVRHLRAMVDLRAEGWINKLCTKELARGCTRGHVYITNLRS